MKRIALLAVIGAGLLAVPGSASAACTGPVNDQSTATAYHICGNVGGLGGDVEIAKNLSYGWIDGFDTNPANSAGYAGFNNGGISDTSKDPDCDGNDDAASSNNSGGCFWIKPAPDAVNNALQNAVTAMFICGNTSGPSHTASKRDGCSVP